MEEAYAVAGDAVLALRLWRPGFFLDPFSTEVLLRDGDRATRAGGPYRQATHDAAEEHLPPYAYRHDEHAPKALRLVRQYRAGALDGPAEAAVQAFQRSYGYQLSPAARCLCLFTALEAMLGGMGKREVGGVHLTMGFRARAESALRLPGAHDGLDAAEEAKWLDTKARRLRTGLAHGRWSDHAESAQAAQGRLQALVRHLLWAYLSFAAAWEEGGRAGMPLAGAFCLSLEADLRLQSPLSTGGFWNAP
jgi:hypothetical protein